MRLIELVRAAKDGNDDIFADLGDKRVAEIVKEVLIELATQIDESKSDLVKVPGLGVFRIKNVERLKNGNMILRQRILFRPTVMAVTKPKKKKVTPKKAGTKKAGPKKASAKKADL